MLYFSDNGVAMTKFNTCIHENNTFLCVVLVVKFELYELKHFCVEISYTLPCLLKVQNKLLVHVPVFQRQLCTTMEMYTHMYLNVIVHITPCADACDIWKKRTMSYD